jgi:hypothetical protein
LAPKGCCISAEAVERIIGQIGETQKATGELNGGNDGKFDRSRRGAGEGFCSVRDGRRSWEEALRRPLYLELSAGDGSPTTVRAGSDGRIYASVFSTMRLRRRSDRPGMMPSAQRLRELITDLAA